MTRILIADDHPLVRGGLKQILRDEFERVRIEEADHSAQTLERVSAQRWDLVLLDINMPGRGGLDVLAEIRRLRPKLPVLILSAAPEGDYALRALKAGASGYINKQHATEELVVAVRTVMAGHNYVSAALAQKLAAGVRRGGAEVAHELLSDREFQIFRLIALGSSVKEIAAQLSLSDKTVATYLTRIREKTGLGSHVEIARYAFQNKLVE
jgi:DNA-binding NarL/FixJ family response regulator